MYRYYTKGVCSKSILLDIEEEIINEIVFEGGCVGNLIGIKQLVEGKSIYEVIDCLEGIQCKNKNTSCPDQLANALLIYKEKVLNNK